MIFGIAEQSTERCSWCDEPVDIAAGWRLREHPGARNAAFCRLEHVVPWAMRGAHWEAGDEGEPPAPETCSQCGAALGDVRVVLVRHRGEHRIPDAFCSVDHMADWAKSCGRWAQP
jgi:hypothetical protein